MIADATLHEIVGILLSEADCLEVEAHLAVENHHRDYAFAKVARASRLRAIVAEIHTHLLHAPAAPSDEAITT